MNELLLAQLNVRGTATADLKAQTDLQIPDPEDKEVTKETDANKESETECIELKDLPKTK